MNEEIKKIKKDIVVNYEEEEIKIALLEDGEVAELIIEREDESSIVGNVYIGKVSRVVPSLEAVFVEVGMDKAAYMPFSEIVENDKYDRKQAQKHVTPKLKKGDSIPVQITKAPISTKGARCSMNVSLPGRLLVYMPFEDHLGISKNIQKSEERERLKEIMRGLVNGITGGFIVRTEAEGVEKAVLKREVEYLVSIWAKIQKQKKKAQLYSLVHKDLGVVFKIIRDKLTSDVDTFVIDAKGEYDAAKSFISMISPDYADKVVYYKSKLPILKAYGIDKVLENIMKQKIYLPSGGYIIIQEAESLCAIDVNSGRAKAENLEQTVLKTNIEAVKEVALQLRLRNIGGIIVIDFIDMYKKLHRQQVLDELKKATLYDKAKIKILPVTAMGLIEMTRQRKRESIVSYLSDKCPYCDGSGRVYSQDTIFLAIKRELVKLSEKIDGKAVFLLLHPAFKQFLTKEKIKKLEDQVNKKIDIQFDYKININDYELRIK
ncbi:MAG: Rne/Rng family ribonuclease [Elusimicrobiota bacterium]